MKSNSTASAALLRKLRQYSLMTSPLVAGSGIASGQIIYNDIDPDITIISDSGTFAVETLDLNNDGVFDFIIGVDHSIDLPYPYDKFNAAAVRLYSDNGHAVVGYTSFSFFNLPSALDLGNVVGPDQNFVEPFPYYGTLFVQYVSGATFGQWVDVTNQYMGFRLAESDGLHYGWLRMDVSNNEPTIVIKDYAYNAVAGLGIIAGATPQGCVDLYEPNDHKPSATSVSLNTTYAANINSVTDRDWYAFHVDAPQNNLRIVLSDLPANYDMLLVKGNSTIAFANNNRKTNDTIVVNGASSGEFKLVIASSNAKFSATECYSLSIEASSSPFRLDKPDTEYSLAQLISVYPNPASEKIRIDLTPFENGVKDIQLKDQMGRVLYYNQFETGQPSSIISIGCEAFPSGTYLLVVTTESGVMIRKISVVH